MEYLIAIVVGLVVLTIVYFGGRALSEKTED